MLNHLISPTLRHTIRDLRELPAPARRAWISLAVARRLGRDHIALPRTLGLTPRITFVCYGNIYRSAVAAALFAAEARRRNYAFTSISSFGLLQKEGRSSPDDAKVIAEELGVSLGEHRSRYLSDDQIGASDLIVLMDRRNEALLGARNRHALERAVLLGAFALGEPSDGPEIPDPYGKGIAAVRQCFHRIELAVGNLADAITRTSAHRTP